MEIFVRPFGILLNDNIRGKKRSTNNVRWYEFIGISEVCLVHRWLFCQWEFLRKKSVLLHTGFTCCRDSVERMIVHGLGQIWLNVSYKYVSKWFVKVSERKQRNNIEIYMALSKKARLYQLLDINARYLPILRAIFLEFCAFLCQFSSICKYYVKNNL